MLLIEKEELKMKQYINPTVTMLILEKEDLIRTSLELENDGLGMEVEW